MQNQLLSALGTSKLSTDTSMNLNSDQLSGDFSGVMSEAMSDAMPDIMPGVMPGVMLGAAPIAASEGTLNALPELLPEDIQYSVNLDLPKNTTLSNLNSESLQSMELAKNELGTLPIGKFEVQTPAGNSDTTIPIQASPYQRPVLDTNAEPGSPMADDAILDLNNQLNPNKTAISDQEILSQTQQKPAELDSVMKNTAQLINTADPLSGQHTTTVGQTINAVERDDANHAVKVADVKYSADLDPAANRQNAIDKSTGSPQLAANTMNAKLHDSAVGLKVPTQQATPLSQQVTADSSMVNHNVAFTEAPDELVARSTAAADLELGKGALDFKQFNQQNIQNLAQFKAVHNIAAPGNLTPDYAVTPTSTQNSPTIHAQVTQAMDDSAWMQNVSDKIMLLTNAQNSTAKIQIHPPELGHILAQLKVSHGNAELLLSAQNPAVRDALEMNINQLRDSMQQANLKLDNVNISQHDLKQDHQHQDFSEKGQQSHQSGLQGDSKDELVAVNEQGAHSQQTVADGVIDYFV